MLNSYLIRDTLRLELAWRHYRSLIRIDKPASGTPKKPSSKGGLAQAVMPTEAELQAELERDRSLLHSGQMRHAYLSKAHEAGRPQPTLCKHGGEAEPAQALLKRLLALFASSLRSSQ